MLATESRYSGSSCSLAAVFSISDPLKLDNFPSAYAFASDSIEFASKGIRFNLVSPGMTNTDLIADVPEKTKMVTAAQTPLRKLASPIDIANTISFLTSHDYDHITGETIRINGGKVMK